MKETKRPGPGQPPLPPEKRRDKRAYISVTGEELDIIDAQAHGAGTSRMAWLRSLILYAIR